MARLMSVSGTIRIAAEPRVVYDAVSDPRQMDRWSPENTGAVLAGPTPEMQVGTSFVGSNKRGAARWVTRCTVIAADPGARFAFRVHQIGWRTPRINAPIATWDYRFVATDSGTEVTEIWTDGRRNWRDGIANRFDRVVTRGDTFAQFQTKNIRTTLTNLKRAIETD
ncbi:MAG: SRPBCC family protein [Jatrophihabitantaceae bacterium]